MKKRKSTARVLLSDTQGGDFAPLRFERMLDSLEGYPAELLSRLVNAMMRVDNILKKFEWTGATATADLFFKPRRDSIVGKH